MLRACGIKGAWLIRSLPSCGPAVDARVGNRTRNRV
jgi:hypothetical protein